MDSSTALLLVDVQVGFDDPYWGSRNNPGAEAVLGRVLDVWRRHGWPVVHVRHLSQSPQSPLRPGQPGVEIQPVVRPLATEPVLQKQVHSAFIGTDLETRLRTAGIRRLVVGGLTTNHCVSTTVRMACDLGFDVVVLADGTAAFACTGPDGRMWTAQDLHDATLASLDGEFATVRMAHDVLQAIAPPPPTDQPARVPGVPRPSETRKGNGM
jgi:nicotinamidase-related amidase